MWPSSSSNRVSQLLPIDHAINTRRRHQQYFIQVSRNTEFSRTAARSSTLDKLPGSIEDNGERPKLLLRSAGCSTLHPGTLKGRPPACSTACCTACLTACCTACLCAACLYTASLCTACCCAACLCTSCCVLQVELHVVYCVLYCMFMNCVNCMFMCCRVSCCHG